MNSLVKEFTQARDKLLKVIKKIKPIKRQSRVLGNWDLTNIIAHLSGWALYQIDILQKIKREEKITIPDNINQFNDASVQKRSKWNWNQIIKEFEDVSEKLINEYQTLEKSLWSKNMIDGGKNTPEDFIQIEIKHYKKTHLPQIMKLL